ncbi:hypothetical protein LJR231_001153 [Phyllobacterium sp. LjRoot231]
MPSNEKTRGGSSEKQSKADQQSHKNMPGQQQQEGMKRTQQGSGSTRGGTSEQPAKAGQQSHKNK